MKNAIPFPEVNRVEVIDENGRSYVKYNCNNVKICLQDDGHTVKLFLDKENKDKTMSKPIGTDEMLDRIEELEAENETLRKALEIYQRERDRYKHATPEMTGAYFLTGGHGPKDDNQMPQFVEVVPAYGCGWSMIYEDTGRTISYEGS